MITGRDVWIARKIINVLNGLVERIGIRMSPHNISQFPFSFRQLEVFHTLSESESFRMTAENLNISQASVSNQIRSLEEQLGITLVSRHPGKKSVLTPAGLNFLTDLNAFYDAANKLRAHRNINSIPPKTHAIKVVIGQGLLHRFVKPRLDEFLSKHGDINITFNTVLPYGEDPSKFLRENNADLALIHIPEDKKIDPNFTYLAYVENGLYGHKSFIEEIGNSPNVEKINDLPFILPSKGSPKERETILAFAGAGIRPKRVVNRTQYQDVMASMICRGDGIGLLSEVMLFGDTFKDVVKLHKFPGWHLAWYRNPQIEGGHVDALEQFLLNSLREDDRYPMLTY